MWASLLGLAAAWLVAAPSRPPRVPVVAMFPDPIVFATHAVLASAVLAIGGPPGLAAEEWIKAAAHAGSRAEVVLAGAELAWIRTWALGDAGLEANVCGAWRHGSPPVRDAIQRGGFRCSDDRVGGPGTAAWVFDGGRGPSLPVDLGRPRSIAAVRVVWANGFAPTTYDVELSLDGTSWFPVWSGANGDGTFRIGRVGRYLRLNPDAHADAGQFQLATLTVTGALDPSETFVQPPSRAAPP